MVKTIGCGPVNEGSSPSLSTIKSTYTMADYQNMADQLYEAALKKLENAFASTLRPADDYPQSIPPCPLCKLLPPIEQASLKPIICEECETELDRKAASYGGDAGEIAKRYLKLRDEALGASKTIEYDHVGLMLRGLRNGNSS